MKLTKLTIIFIFILAFAVSVLAQKLDNEKIKLSKQDKSEILQQVFDDGFEKLFNENTFNQCLTPIVDEKKVVFVMSEVHKDLLPKEFKKYSFMNMTYSQINEEVKKNNRECYFKLGNFQTIDSKIRVLLSRYIDQIYRFENSDKYTQWTYGESYVYEFQKFNKKWKISSTKKHYISS